MKIYMYKPLITAICLGLGMMQHTKAQQDSSKLFSLKEAVEYARKNSFTLQNARLDQLDAKAKVKETLALGLPQVNANVSFNNNFQLTPFYFNISIPGFPPSPPDITRAGAKIAGTANLSARQLIFDGSYLVGLEASREYVKLSEKISSKTETETEVNVAKAYFMVLMAEENISLLDKNLQQLEKTYSDTRALYANGMVEKTDVDRLELGVSELKLQKEKVMDQVELARRALKLQMGYPVNQAIALSDKLDELYKSNATLNEKNTLNTTGRIEYQLLDQQIKLNELNLKRYRIGSLPSISAIYNFTESSFLDASFKALTPKPWYASSFLGLSMDVPIFDGFRKKSLKQQSHVAIDKLNNDKKNLENAINLEAFKAQTDYETSIKQVEIRKRNLKLAENIYSTVSNKFKQGVGSSFELTQSETDLKTAQVNYLNSVYELLVAKIELNKALGKHILN